MRSVGCGFCGREELVASEAHGAVLVRKIADFAVALVERDDSLLLVLDVEADVWQRVHHALDGFEVFSGLSEECLLKADLVSFGHGFVRM